MNVPDGIKRRITQNLRKKDPRDELETTTPDTGPDPEPIPKPVDESDDDGNNSDRESSPEKQNAPITQRETLVNYRESPAISSGPLFSDDESDQIQVNHIPGFYDDEFHLPNFGDDDFGDNEYGEGGSEFGLGSMRPTDLI